jgi:hypothetical protein
MKDKIQQGLKLTYEKLLADKRLKNNESVILRDK